MLLAVLERHAGLQLGGHNVFVNAAGGVRVEEPGADLGLAVAIASSFTDKSPVPRAVFVGEVGLGGEIRAVTQLGPRLVEAERLGFRRAFVPKDGMRGLDEEGMGLDIAAVSNMMEALDGGSA
jgi:DNA repair protein RadA/Sms